jgi:hypothetical protein
VDQQVQDALSVLFGNLVKETPELVEVMERAKRGELTETEAMSEMMRLVASKSELGTKVTQLAQLPPLPPLQRPGLFRPVTTDATKLNPLVAGALAERLQFDGDAPEMRTGPLPQGVFPAIPVASTALDPVVLGQQLQKAATELKQKLEEHHQKQLGQLETVAGQMPEVLALVQKHGELTAKQQADLVAWGSPETDHPEYRRGQVPAPVAAPKPSGSALASLTPGQRHEMAWRFLSTTQGRRTAVTAVQEIIEAELKAAGLSVVTRAFTPDVTHTLPLAAHEWTLTLSGPGATQPAFSFLTVAARALSKRLLKDLGDRKDIPVYLEVTAVNRIADREVGWAARLLART